MQIVNGPSAAGITTAALFTSLLLVACAPIAPRDGAPSGPTPTSREFPPDPVPKTEPRSRYGNGPVYEVFGQRYEVLDSSLGYQAQGVASWYGKKFHGRLTASREPYDMYAMTAAHKSLPIPSYVEVRNLKNNRRIVVRVNDRGPFVDNRIIDLSYSAALKLDMVRDGTSLVEVTALGSNVIQASGDTASQASDPAPAASADIYVQVGAFGDRANAERRFKLLKERGIGSSFVHREQRGQDALYRVRIGPISGVQHYDRVVADLNRIGIQETHLVSE